MTTRWTLSASASTSSVRLTRAACPRRRTATRSPVSEDAVDRAIGQRRDGLEELLETELRARRSVLAGARSRARAARQDVTDGRSHATSVERARIAPLGAADDTAEQPARGRARARRGPERRAERAQVVTEGRAADERGRCAERAARGGPGARSASPRMEPVPATVIVGAQWGDEGKGKIVDLLAQESDLVCRYQGGPNAGHTIVVGDETYKIRQIPSRHRRRHRERDRRRVRRRPAAC